MCKVPKRGSPDPGTWMANQGSAGGYLCLFFTGRQECEAYKLIV